VTHVELVDVASRWLRRKGCGVVLTEHHGGTLEIPDAIGFKGWHSIQVECKVSVADFRADAKKAGRRFDRTTGEYRQAAERWFLTPLGLVATTRAELVDWGLLAYDGKRVRVIEPAIVEAKSEHVWRAEVMRLFCELRRYQAQGIRYLTIAEQQRKPLAPEAPEGEVNRG
jgi:hypothetical protein